MTRLDIIRSITIDGIQPFSALDLKRTVRGLADMWECRYGGCPLHREDGETCHCGDCKKEITKWLVAENARS